MIDQTVSNNKKVAYYTLDCKLNFAETSTIGKLLTEQGVREVRPGEKADICVVNICSVTELADKKCRQTVRRISKQRPSALIVVTGCYAQLKPGEVSHIEDVDLILDAEQKLGIPQYPENLEKREHGRTVTTSQSKDIRSFSPSYSAGDRTRHLLKVQDGYDYYYFYCTIPFARGRGWNGTIVSMAEQAQEVTRKGGKEIVLTGVDVGDFGKSTGETFINLVRTLGEVERTVRYRISSIEPNLITDETIDFVTHSRRFAPHFHVPLQSSSDAILQLMHHRYDTALFRHKIKEIREVMPHAFIGVDVVAGARGGTDEYFEGARQFIDSLDISQLHVFSCSERPGTQALKIDYIVGPKTKHARSQQPLDVSDQKLHAFYEAHIGQEADVLFEHIKKNGKMHGFTENYTKVEVPYDATLVNETRKVVLGGWNEDRTALIVNNQSSTVN